MEAPLSEHFFTRRMNVLIRPDSFMLYGKLGVEFFSTFEFLYPNMKIRLTLIIASSKFYMFSESPNVSFGIVHCSLYNRHIALRDDRHKNEWTCLHIFPWNTTIWKLWQRFPSLPLDETSSIKEPFLTMLQFVGLLLQWIQTLLPLDRTMKTSSGINSSILDKFEYPEVVSQL